MPGAFEDLLNKSDRLSASAKFIAKPSSSSSHQHRSRVDLALNDIFRCSENLWRKKVPGDDRSVEMEVGILLGGKGCSLTAVPQIQESSKEAEVEEIALPSGDCQQMLDEIVAETSKLTRLEAERAFMNQRVVDQAYTRAKPIAKAAPSDHTLASQVTSPASPTMNDHPTLPSGTQGEPKHSADSRENEIIVRDGEELNPSDLAVISSSSSVLYSRKNKAADRISSPSDQPFAGGNPHNGSMDSSTLITSADSTELAFAKGVADFILHKKANKLAADFKESASKARDAGINALWEQAVTPLNCPIIVSSPTKEFRTSMPWTEHIIASTLEFLHKNFIIHMETVVQSNLAIARRGGNPTMLSLIDAFLNVKHFRPTHRQTQDGVYGPNGHALWEVVYYCLRAGELESVEEVANSHLKNLPSCAAAAIALLELKKTKKLSADVRLKVKAEWRCESRTCVDIYKKAVYCALLGGDVPEVCNNLETWLWLKLHPCSLDPALSPAVFKELQRLISVDYGESYFVGSDGSVLIYFQALWLTGQYECAISLLYRNGMLVHAVHMAILLFVNELLILVDNVTDPMMTNQKDDPVQCSLNFCRLILLYIKQFECSDVARSLDYAYFLKSMESPVGGNLFYSCISRAVYLNGETWRIIGKISENGIRHEGLIDKYINDINIDDAIAKVALDTQLSGDATLAGQLYMAANHIDDAVQLACEGLAKEIIQHKDDGEARKLAVWLACICKRAMEKTRKSTQDAIPNLYLLIDLSTFFQCFREERYEACMEIIKKLKCIPLNPDEVQAFVSTFYMVSDQVRLVLPDLCLTMMKLLVEELNRNPEAIDDFRPPAKAIILYVAMIPYRFPSQINTQILQLNTRFE